MTEIQSFGSIGEDYAASYLQTHGYTILKRNWRYGHLELDLICSDQDQIVFVEVKTRRSNNYGGPEGAITKQKIKNLSKAAQAWLSQNEAWTLSCRFDVICITGSINDFHLEHYPNAFLLCAPSG